VRVGGADAVAMADILHYGRAGIGDIWAFAKASGLPVRDYDGN
jgi:cyclase